MIEDCELTLCCLTSTEPSVFGIFNVDQEAEHASAKESDQAVQGRPVRLAIEQPEEDGQVSATESLQQRSLLAAPQGAGTVAFYLLQGRSGRVV